MQIPEMSSRQKIEQFCKSNPQYKKMSIDQICSIMLKEKILTSSEIEELKNPLFTYIPSGLDNFDSAYKSMGLFINSSETDYVEPDNYVELPKKRHPILTSFMLTSEGKVDLSQFSLNALQEKYNTNEYVIDQINMSRIDVKNKTDNSLVFSIHDFVRSGLSIITFYDKNTIEQAFVDKDGNIISFNITEENEASKSLTYYSNSAKFPIKKVEILPNGDTKQTRFDEKSGKIEYYQYWQKEGNTAEISINYSDGKPYKKEVGKNIEYILVNDLIGDISAKTKLGFPTTKSSLSSDVLNRIVPDNILDTVNIYKDKTGRNLVDDINDEIGLSRNLRKNLINHIETLYCQKASAKDSGTYLGTKLYEDIQGLGSGQLSEHIKMITPDNLKYLLIQYKSLSRDDNLDLYFHLTNSFYNFNDMIGNILSIDLGEKISEDLVELISPIENLLTAISNEWGISQVQRNELIKQIIDISLDDCPDNIKSRFSRDISTHDNDYHKVEIDVYRTLNSGNGDFRNPNNNQKKLINNNMKTLYANIKQGNYGDCWLLAGLISIIAKPEILKQLNQLVVYDPKTDSYSVKFKGASNKLYTITNEDLNAYQGLATGSEKVNAIEIAMDKYIRDMAYEDESLRYIDSDFNHVTNVDINGNNSSFFWQTLFGDNLDKSLEPVDVLKEDFNTPNKLYTISLSGSDDINVTGIATSNSQKDYSFNTRHSYSIIGSDKENIYLLNPWDSSDKITISRENVKKYPFYIQSFEVLIQ